MALIRGEGYHFIGDNFKNPKGNSRRAENGGGVPFHRDQKTPGEANKDLVPETGTAVGHG